MTDIVERRFEAIRRLLVSVPAIQPASEGAERTGVAVIGERGRTRRSKSEGGYAGCGTVIQSWSTRWL
jgi:hypothetical protein